MARACFGSRMIPAAVMLTLFMCGCREETKLDVASRLDPSRMPSLSTRNVETLISDSGHTKYKILTPLWNIYSEGGDPHWDFPEGVYLRQLDRQLKEVAVVVADSAKYFTGRKLWQLMGNVEIDQKGKSYFSSQRIFFDDRGKRIYSDTFIHIETPTQILEGLGFESNQDLTRYTVLRPTGVFPVEQETRRELAGEGAGTPQTTLAPRPAGMP